MFMTIWKLAEDWKLMLYCETLKDGLWLTETNWWTRWIPNSLGEKEVFFATLAV